MTRPTKIVAILVLLMGAGSAWADLTDGLVAHWKFDETDGTIAYDSAGDNDGTLVNGPIWTTGMVNGALDFDGVNDYVDCDSTFASVTASDTKSIMAWVKPDSATEPARLITLYRRSDSSSAFALRFDGTPATWSSLYMKSAYGYEWLYSGVPVEVDQWTHIALVQNRTQVDIYVNGISENSVGNGAVPTLSNPPNAVLGAYMWWGHYPSGGFNGIIDDVRIYNRALSAAEIEQLYLSEELELVGLEITGPNEVAENHQTQYQAIAIYDNNTTADVTHLAKWSVEPNVVADIEAGLLATDKIFEPQAVTITAEYTEADITAEDTKQVSIFAICPSGSALEFDGVNDYLHCGSSNVFKILGDMTVSFWFNREQTWLESPTLIAIEEGAGDPENAVFYTRILYGSSSLADITYGHEYAGGLNQNYNFNVDIGLGCWTHIAIARDSLQKKIKAYKNGVLLDTFSYTYDPTAVSEELVATIGGRCDLASHRFLKGSMDDIRVYDRALSAEEVGMIMHARPAVDEPNLVGYWDFDEGEGQVAYDTSGSGNDGQLGSDPNADDSDPAWVDSDAPVGICTPEGLVERNVNEALEIKLTILDEILEALAREDASVNILSGLFGEAQYGHLDKRDIIKAKQEIHSAIQGEEQAIDSLEKSAGDLEDSLEALSGQNGPTDSPPQGSSLPPRQSKTLTKPAPTEVIRKPSRK